VYDASIFPVRELFPDYSFSRQNCFPMPEEEIFFIPIHEPRTPDAVQMVKKESNSDSRHKLLDRALSKHQGKPEALIEVLHRAQQVFGYLPRDVLSYVASALRLPLSQVFGVASFYPLFSLTPPCEHNLTICMGTACYVNGAAGLLREAMDACECDAGAGEKEISIRAAHCLGACGNGPIIKADQQTTVKADAAAVRDGIAAFRENIP
jgi:bidirectional [NiFe] hydrogenase diaphorase subunit